MRRRMTIRLAGAAAVAAASMLAIAGMAATPASAAAEQAAAPIAAVGVIEDGVEGACKVLNTELGTDFVLVRYDFLPPVGTRVKVTGDLLAGGSACGQGPVVDVETVVPVWG